jgi:hypothetical protein
MIRYNWVATIDYRGGGSRAFALGNTYTQEEGALIYDNLKRSLMAYKEDPATPEGNRFDLTLVRGNAVVHFADIVSLSLERMEEV